MNSEQMIALLEKKLSKEREDYNKLNYENQSNLCWVQNLKEEIERLVELRDFFKDRYNELTRDSNTIGFYCESNRRNAELMTKNFDLKEKIVELEKNRTPECNCNELKVKLNDFEKEGKVKEKELASEKEKNEKDRKNLLAEIEKLKTERRVSQDKVKSAELTSIKMSKQISDFEKLIFMERQKAEKEKKELEVKIDGLSTKYLNYKKSWIPNYNVQKIVRPNRRKILR